MKVRVLVFVLAAALSFIVPVAATYAAVTSKDIEKELMCQCGCTMVVDVCECETANQIRAKISGFLEQGQDKDQIVGYFVSRYGEEMLSSPPKKGFSLVAWIAPFAAVAAGGTFLLFLLRGWARKGRGAGKKVATMTQPAATREAEDYRRRLEEELKRFNEEDSR